MACLRLYSICIVLSFDYVLSFYKQFTKSISPQPVCSRSSDPCSNLLYKMGHYFLDTLSTCAHVNIAELLSSYGDAALTFLCGCGSIRHTKKDIDRQTDNRELENRE